MPIIYPLTLPATPGVRTAKFGGNNLVGINISPFTGQQEVQSWPGEWWELEFGLPPMMRAEAEQWVSFLLALRGQTGTFLAGDPFGTVAQGSCSGSPMTGGAPSVQIISVKRTSNTVTASCTYSASLASYFVVGADLNITFMDDASFDGAFTLQTVAVSTVGGVTTWTFTWSQISPNTGTIIGTGSVTAEQNMAGDPILWTTDWTPNQAGVLLPGDYLQVGSGSTQRLYKALTVTSSDAAGNAAIDIYPTLREPLADGTPLVLTNATGTFRLADNRRQWDVDYMRTYGIDFKAIEAI